MRKKGERRHDVQCEWLSKRDKEVGGRDGIITSLLV